MERSVKVLMVILAVAAVLFIAEVVTVANAETEKPRFVFAAYEPGHGVRGIAEIPQGFKRCYVTGVFFDGNEIRAVVIMPINVFGEFSCDAKLEEGNVRLMIVENVSGLPYAKWFEAWEQWEMNYLDFVPPDAIDNPRNGTELGRGGST